MQSGRGPLASSLVIKKMNVEQKPKVSLIFFVFLTVFFKTTNSRLRSLSTLAFKSWRRGCLEDHLLLFFSFFSLSFDLLCPSLILSNSLHQFCFQNRKTRPIKSSFVNIFRRSQLFFIPDRTFFSFLLIHQFPQTKKRHTVLNKHQTPHTQRHTDVKRRRATPHQRGGRKR